MKRTPNPRGIEPISPGKYRIRAIVVDPATGRRLESVRTIEAPTVTEAAAEREKLKRALLHGPVELPAAAARVRVGDFARSWLESRLPRLRPSTAGRYGRDLDRMCDALGDLYLDAITPEHVQAWLASVSGQFSPGTLNGNIRTMRVLFADAVVTHRLAVNPMARVRTLPDHHQEDDVPRNMLSAEEMGRFLAMLGERWPQWYPIVFTQFALALRFGEVSALQWDDVDEERGVVRIRRAQCNGIVGPTKTRRTKTVPLTPELREVLSEHRARLVQHPHVDSGWVFPSLAGKPHVNSCCLTDAFKDVLVEIGVSRPFSAHGLRRTANDLLRRVASGEVTRAITGHVTTAMTEHYSHVDVAEKQAAAAGLLRLVQGGKGAA